MQTDFIFVIHLPTFTKGSLKKPTKWVNNLSKCCSHCYKFKQHLPSARNYGQLINIFPSTTSSQHYTKQQRQQQQQKNMPSCHHNPRWDCRFSSLRGVVIWRAGEKHKECTWFAQFYTLCQDHPDRSLEKVDFGRAVAEFLGGIKIEMFGGILCCAVNA